jgi:hypothetical protein
VRLSIAAWKLRNKLIVPEATTRLDIVVVAKLLIPPTVILPEISTLPVLDASVKERCPGTLRYVIVDEEMVVVARVVRPRTTNGPVEVDP